ncbi:hypothetical protein C8A00DRAFT_34969 [Chaetomidium leptoderma]|uniref:Uncharacterized protein n=1 Tax=Chaetomidium leptoderma TaxID=669021 RepID=A0AAN6VJM0_9PEZI|nr:hypothetical protein C8A00DRAFT_34969 [Chaetomidium leptoderma]
MASGPTTCRSWRQGASPGAHRHNQGDIAFLYNADQFSKSDSDALIQAPIGHSEGYIPTGATGHPVIILGRLSEHSTHVLVTTVSSYRADQLGLLSPWKQPRHRKKDPEDFRSFAGCQRPSEAYPPLSLLAGQSLPKPRTGWVYVQCALVVPLSVLGPFGKTCSGEPFQMQPSSLAELRLHFAAKCLTWRDCERRLAAAEPSPVALLPAPSLPTAPSPATPSPTSCPSWRERPSCPAVPARPPKGVPPWEKPWRRAVGSEGREG